METFLAKSDHAAFVSTAEDLNNLDFENTDHVLGLFAEDNLPFHSEIAEMKDETRPPTLVEMAESAIKILSKNENGFFLAIENENVDNAHHKNMV